jgi:hypothetical protein
VSSVLYDRNVLGAKIFPLLLDENETRSIANLSRVCRQWNEVMQSQVPYRNTQNFRLSQFTLWKRMQRTFQAAVANTPNWESRILVPLALTNPHFVKGEVWAGTIFLSALPNLTEISRFLRNPSPRLVHIDMNTIGGFFVFANMLLMLPMTAATHFCEKEDFFGVSLENNWLCQNLEETTMFLLWGLMFSLTQSIRHNGENLLSQTYRITKGAAATSVPAIKTTYSRLKNWFNNYLRYYGG